MSAYFASKAAALNSTDRWIEREKPHFDVVNIFPAFVFGRDELCDSTADFQRTTNNLIVNVALGNAARAMSLPFVYTTINDAALAHVLALDSKIAGNRGYLVCNYGEEGGWDDVLSIIEKRYADQVKRGDFKPSETWSTQPVSKSLC
jgi:succinate dehydrogenase (ubiquinone) flavoprotein subunit